MGHRACRVLCKVVFRNTKAILALAALIAPGLASAQDYKNPERRFLDAIGVSINEGIYHREITPLTIGDPATGGLAWTYHGHAYTFKGDYIGTVTYDSGLNETTVSFGETSYPFENGTSYTNGHGSSDTLTTNANGYLYTTEDGTVYTYTGTPSTSYALTSILKPNGLKITINSGSVVTNTGYALKFDSSTGKISAVNMLAHSCDAQALSCDAYDNSVYFLSSYTDPDITGTGGRYQVTDALGNAWRWRWYFSYVLKNPSDPQDVSRGPGVVWAFKDPTGVLVKLNYASGTGDLVSYTDPRGTFTYNTNPVTDPSGAAIYYGTGSYDNSTSTQTSCYLDALSHGSCYAIRDYRTATNPYNGFALGPYTRILSVTNQEGDAVSFTYNARGNITATTRTPKPGSGLSATTTYSGYDATCSNLKTCNQPNWTKDAKGNQADYTYSATHGGVLTVTLPADVNGLRRRTYNTYTSYDTGNGLIYRLTRTETCALNSGQLSLSACPATSDTAVILTDYGTSATAPKTYKSFQPYSVTKTDGAASLSVTTTYTYDNLGNVTVVDGPRTDVDDRVYKTYDLNRQVIFEIGPVPGGNGSPKRAVKRHWYDAAGKEWKTEVGYANANATDGSDFVVTAFTRVTFDAAGRPIKTEQVQP